MKIIKLNENTRAMIEATVDGFTTQIYRVRKDLSHKYITAEIKTETIEDAEEFVNIYRNAIIILQKKGTNHE